MSLRLPDILKRSIYIAICAVFGLLIFSQAVFAQSLSQDDQNSIYNDTVWYKVSGSTASGCELSTTSLSTGSNVDYAGRNILSQVDLQLIGQNEPVYQQAAQQVGIPWQVLAAVHYREHSLKTDEPDTTGVYQITNSNDRTAGAYPPAGTQLTQGQFLQQSIDAANFIKSDGAGLTVNSDAAAIKDAFGLYNGLPPLYKQQAINLGFGANQAYEGSPYVMNFADAPRDPTVAAPGTWLQYTTATTTATAGTQYGAFLVYADLTGSSVGGGCISTVSCAGSNNATVGLSTIRQDIVCVAEQELQKWSSGQLKPGSGYLTYTQQHHEDWCADFASWVYNQAGDAFGPVDSPSNNWRVSYVPNLLAPPQDTSKFTTHGVNGYTPQPGDLAIHGDRHVNIVVGVKGNQMTLIGGNQGSNDFEQSSVTLYQTDFTDGGDITNFVSPN